MIDSSKKLGYGYGWFVGALEKPELVYHTGSNGGFRAIVVTIPSENYALIIFSNRTGIDLENLVTEINRIFNSENKSLQRIDSLISFNRSWPIFAPCKKTRRFLISSRKNWNGREMA
jgi:CubicO group peptidase (beta-lactamase class C family)